MKITTVFSFFKTGNTLYFDPSVMRNKYLSTPLGCLQHKSRKEIIELLLGR